MSKGKNLCIKAYLDLRGKLILRVKMFCGLKGSKLNLVMRMSSHWLRWGSLEFFFYLKGDNALVLLIMLSMCFLLYYMAIMHI
jgi:hypothetical protein